MRGECIQEVYSYGFDWEDFGVLDQWCFKEVVAYNRCLHNHGGSTVLLQVSKTKYSWLPITRTLDNPNLLLTWRFCFPTDQSFLYNFSLENLQKCYKCATIWGKKTLYWSPKLWIYFKTTVSIPFFVTPVEILCSSMYIICQALLFNCIPSPSIYLFLHWRCSWGSLLLLFSFWLLWK